MANKNYENKNEYTEKQEGGAPKKPYNKKRKFPPKKDREPIVRKKEEIVNEVDSDGFEIVGTKQEKQLK